MRISIIACIGNNYGIGFEGKLPWSLPDDLKRFKENTLNHPIIMGRSTYESLGNKPLPKRTNIVLTTRPLDDERILVANNMEDALNCAKTLDSETFIIGGGKIYEQTINLSDRILLTRVNASSVADTFFPRFEESEFNLVEKILHPKDAKHAYDFCFLTYERRL